MIGGEAQRGGVHEQGYFFWIFKREFGLTPVEYIVREQLAEAKRLRRHPLASVAAVCLRAGFDNLSYFQALFKKYEGLTPGAYKKQHTLWLRG